jgi:hypothetical protein
MLDIRVLKTEERFMGHMSFLPQEVVRWDVWTGVFREGTIVDNNLHEEKCN